MTTRSLFCFSAFAFWVTIAACNVENTTTPTDTVEKSQTYSADQSTIRLELIPESQTGISFNNSIRDEGRLNVFVWNFLYSGAGVAAGDINNDGLPDLYFAANQGSDRLYLNKGNFQFEDITESAGLNDRQWSTGVTMADVNADGLIDIYVCKNSAIAKPDVNRNKLWINQGNNRFLEKSAEFGLDDIGFSIQSTFFDIDNDGDLDMFLINQPFDEFAKYINTPEQVQNYPSTDRMFINEGGKFVDMTIEKGVVNSRYGLNATLADFNLDGWTDLYVCNDYHHADHLYINHNGTFVDELLDRTGHISFFAMGSDAGDINNDGWPDLISLDMAFGDHYRSKTNMPTMQPERFWNLVADDQHYQYAQNTLQLNTGSGYFIEIAQMSGIAKTDWSWAPLFTDLDNDGLQDLLITNGIMKDMKNNDFVASIQKKYQGQVGPDNYLDVLATLPSNPIANKLYRNNGQLVFDDISQNSGFNFEGFSQGMVSADFDGDGRMDIAVNNMNAVASIYKNNSTSSGNYLNVRIIATDANRNGLGITAIAHIGLSKTIGTIQSTRGYMSASEPLLHFGLGSSPSVDSITIIWNHRYASVLKDIPANQTITIDYSKVEKQKYIPPSERKSSPNQYNSTIDFKHTEIPYDDYAQQILLPYKLSQNGPYISTGDFNADNLTDLYIGGAAGQPGAIFMQQENGSFIKSDRLSGLNAVGFEDMQSVIADFDGDGSPDLYVVSGSNEFSSDDPMLMDRMYLNDGNGNLFYAPEFIPQGMCLNGQCVIPIDLDQDGDTDLFVGGRLVGGEYIQAADSRILINNGSKFEDLTSSIAPFLKDFGMVTDGVATDVDGDGDIDIFIVGEWMTPTFLINNNGHFVAQPLDDSLTGIWWTVEQADVNNDGRPDFILGNLGWNNKFGGRKANLKVYAGDIDKNGDYDVILAKQKGDHLLPIRGRECSSEELPFLLEKYPSYDAFGKAHLDDILSDIPDERSVFKSIGTFSSVLMLNKGNMKFETTELPVECQTGPIKAIAFLDANQDGNTDFIYVGNHYPVEVETARYDGLQSGISLGNGNGNFSCFSIYNGDKPLQGDFRDVELLNTKAGILAVMTRNNGTVESILVKDILKFRQGQQ